MSTIENKDVSWFKIIMGSAIGMIIGYLALMLFCCLCYLVIFLIFAMSGASLNSNGIYNELTPLMNSVR